jgi:hypothetical protein
MNLQTSVNIFLVLSSMGILMFFYFLIKDRIEVIRSIKPKSVNSFLGFVGNENFNSYFYFRYFLVILILNIFSLVIWVPI